MIDLRYHVYSLAAVFFALAIGIIVGSSFVGNPADRKQMLSVSHRYESSLRDMRTEVRNQQSDLRKARGNLGRSERMCAALLPVALKNRLVYRNVAIIQTGDYDELTTDLTSMIESAGAKVTSVTKILSSFDFEDSVAVSNAMSAANILTKQDERGRNAILRTIADVVVNASFAERLRALEEKNVVSLSGDYLRWNRHVLIIGGSSEGIGRAKLVDFPLVDYLTQMGAPVVVGCEPAAAGSSYVPTWKSADIATVDNVDTACGQVALICALAGEKAHFGQKRTADRLIPQTLGSGQ